MKTFMAFFTAVVGRKQSSSVRTIPTATSRITELSSEMSTVLFL